MMSKKANISNLDELASYEKKVLKCKARDKGANNFDCRTFSKNDDKDLDCIVKSLKGDMEATKELYERYKPLILKYKKYHLSEEYYDDMECELNLEFIKSIKDYDFTRGIPFAGYVRSKISRKASNLRVKQRKNNARHVNFSNITKSSDDEDSEAEPYFLKSKITVEGEWERKNRKDVVELALQYLPPKEFLVIDNFYFKEKPMTAIANELGCNRQYAYRVHNKSLKRIKSKIKNILQ